MVDAVKMGFAKYGDFRGRSTRSEYWYWYLFTVIAVYGSGIIDAGISKNSTILSSIVELVIIFPAICVGIRRMHDTGHRGWWLLFPIVNFIFLVSPSKEDNQYGPQSIG
jgi:uncharacterized membrane protein YhaH (DUF805 family)